MAKSHYNWNNGPAELKPHSIIKHSIIRDYLTKYFLTLAPFPGQPDVKLTLIDGFCGGGLYHHYETNEVVDGSPFICLEAVKEAEFLLNQSRNKPINLDVSYFFVDIDRSAINFLKNILIQRGYLSQIEKSIFLRNGAFNEQYNDIFSFIKKKTPQNGRSIFILDQYGYSKVPFPLIKEILTKLPKAEIILTFNVDALLQYVNAKNVITKLEKNLKKAELKLPEFLKDRSLKEIIDKDDVDWRRFIQTVLRQELTIQSNARFFTPFFITNPEGYGDYWLIHLSQHPTARDVMTGVHWGHQNQSKHYGGAGLDMFSLAGFDPTFSDCFKSQYNIFCFDDPAKEDSISCLMNQIPRLIRDKLKEGAITFEKLYESTCNNTPANKVIFKEVLLNLLREKEVIITGVSGEKRSVRGKNIHDTDIIKLSPYPTLFVGMH